MAANDENGSFNDNLPSEPMHPQDAQHPQDVRHSEDAQHPRDAVYPVDAQSPQNAPQPDEALPSKEGPAPFVTEPFLPDEPAFGTPRRARRPAKRAAAAAPESAGSGAGSDLLWNGLTVLVLLAMLSMIMAVVTILLNPSSHLNPFRPLEPTLVSAVQIPTMTASPRPSATKPGDPSATQAVTGTPTQLPPTFTPTPLPTDTSTPGPSPTPTIHSIYPFILRGEVKMIDGASFPEHDTCKLWVAGQAYDLQGAPMTGATVMLGGYINGKTLSQLSLTGTALQYGPAGYEFTISDVAVDSKQAVWVELFDQAMIPLSARIYFNTSADCSQNLVLVNFRQVR